MSTISSNAGGSRQRSPEQELHGGQSRLDSPDLHIRPDPPAPASASGADRREHVTHSIQDLLESSSISTIVCPDVYRGLARLLAPEWKAPSAVVIRMDDLGRAELEFFSIVSRLCPSVPVYVYGHGRSEARIAEAVDLGATGLADEQTIRGLATEALPARPQTDRVDTRPAGPSDEQAPQGGSGLMDTGTTPARPVTAGRPVVEQPARAEKQVSDYPAAAQPLREQPETEPKGAGQTGVEHAAPAESPKHDQARPAASPASSSTEPGTGGSGGVARVPWLRYEGRPTRTAPQRRPPQPVKDEPTAQTGDSADQPAPSSSTDPLLTEEELRALMGGDDIASIGPGPRDTKRADEPEHGSPGA